MKKFLMSVSMLAAMCVTMSSCLKNDSDNYVAPVDPSVEAPALQAFIDSTGYNMVTQSDSLYLYVSNGTNFELKGYKMPYLYYEIVNPGNLTQGSTDTSDAAIGGSVGGNTTIYNTYTDSTLIASVTYKGTLLNGTEFGKSDEPVLFAIPNMIYAWQALVGKVGKGGEIRILTPSLYGYSNSAKTGIPANSPLYFDVKVVGFVKNSYGK
ncbi:FKBP-type peptidyl-prolyl cis-trans isomerase [Arachidicoccus rhizosphaerae]|nr:FKBP-type peptidyl-prolyl cis-trans isomerase [Arachidicoccus rhizosphaerae]